MNPESISLKFESIAGIPNRFTVMLMNILLVPETEKVIIFGSRAKGNYKPGSDIDIALSGNFENTPIGLLTGQINDLGLPWLTDVVAINEITNPVLLNEIEQYGVVIYQRG